MADAPLSLRIPINDGPDGRVGYLYFTETPEGWRLSLKERGEFGASTGTDRQAGVDAIANSLEAFGNAREATYQRATATISNAPTYRPGFRGDFRERLQTQERVKFHNHRNMLLKTCLQVGERLKEFGWPVPDVRVLNDGTVLRFTS